MSYFKRKLIKLFMKAACKKYNSSVLSWVANTVASSINYFMHRIRGQSISVQKKNAV